MKIPLITLFRRVILAHVAREPLLAGFSVAGVALGIGLFLGVNAAANRAAASFESGIRGFDQAFNYEIAGRAGTLFSEELYKIVRPAAARSLPVLATSAYLPDLNETIEVNGIYTLETPALGRTRPDTALIDLEAFLTGRNSIIISRTLSEEQNLKPGNEFTALVYSREYRLRVAGVVDLPGLPANRALMDLGNFQELFGRVGVLSRIDVAADSGEAARIRAMLPPEVGIEEKESILRNRSSLIDAFKLNLRFVTFLAVLAGVFLLSNTVFISVTKRRGEIGILRGLGMDRKTVVALFSFQGLLLGVLGSLAGLAVGNAGASLAAEMVEKTVSRFYGVTAAAHSPLTPGELAGALLLGLLVSVLASFVPALEAASVRPMESIRPGTFEKQYKGRQKKYSFWGAAAGAIAAAVVAADYLFVPFRFPWLSYAGILLFILGCTLNAPAYLGALLIVLRIPLERLNRTVAPLALGELRGARYRFTMALMSIAVSSALIVAILSSVHSLKQSFVGWIESYLTADAYIKPASCASNFCFDPLPAGIRARVEAMPEVRRVGAYRALEIEFRGRKVTAGFGNSELLWKERPGISTAEKQRLQRLARYREVSVSEYLAVQYGLKPGDRIAIPTPKGDVEFTVNDISISYSTLSGFLYLDARWLREYWGIDDASQLSVYLKEGRDARDFARRARNELKEYALEVTDNKALRSSVLGIFDRSFAITYTIEFIAIAISLIGVVNALFMLVFERKREIAVLRYLGASWAHLRQVMLLSAGIVALGGILLGLFMGVVISIVITHVINKISFGWEVAFQAPLFTIAGLMALLFVVITAAGLPPFLLMRKVDPKAFISFE